MLNPRYAMRRFSRYGLARHSIQGFTLVELLVVIVIVSVLASIGLPLAELAHKRQQEEALRVALRQIRDGLDAYKKAGDSGKLLRHADQSGYPPNLATLVDGVVDASDPMRRKMYFLRRLPPDPFAEDKALPPDLTWGKRSYASDASEPREGTDVYDIYSLSQGTGLNGVPYRKW